MIELLYPLCYIWPAMEEKTTTSAVPNEAEALAEQQKAKEKALLAKKYRDKGAQSVSLKEYLKLEAAKRRKPKVKVPSTVKVAFAVPLTILAVLGAIFIGFIIYLIVTAKNVPVEETKSETSIFSETSAK